MPRLAELPLLLAAKVVKKGRIVNLAVHSFQEKNEKTPHNVTMFHFFS